MNISLCLVLTFIFIALMENYLHVEIVVWEIIK